MAAEITDLATISEGDLAALLNDHADDADIVDRIIAELDSREIEEEPEVDEQAARLALVDVERKPGESRRRCVRRLFHEMTYERYIAAENATQGHLLNKKGLAGEIDPYELFYGPAQQAVDYASRELRDWWQANGRMTEIEYQALMLGYPNDVRKAAAARRNAQSLGL